MNFWAILTMTLNNSYIFEIKDLEKLNFSETKYYFETLKITCCYFINKILINNSYNLNVTFNFETYSIDNSFKLVENIFLLDKVRNNYDFICYRLEEIIELELAKFNILKNKELYVLNIDLILLNNISIILSCKVLKNQ